MKYFISKVLRYSTSVIVDGASCRVQFLYKGRPFQYGYYACTNDKIAEALKKHPSYGKTFFLKDEEEPVKEAKEYNATYEEVSRTQSANKILVEVYGIDKDRLKSKEDALKVAEELNISFPNLK